MAKHDLTKLASYLWSGPHLLLRPWQYSSNRASRLVIVHCLVYNVDSAAPHAARSSAKQSETKVSQGYWGCCGGGCSPDGELHTWLRGPTDGLHRGPLYNWTRDSGGLGSGREHTHSQGTPPTLPPYTSLYITPYATKATLCLCVQTTAMSASDAASAAHSQAEIQNCMLAPTILLPCLSQLCMLHIQRPLGHMPSPACPCKRHEHQLLTC